jgi:hypothetical protein
MPGRTPAPAPVPTARAEIAVGSLVNAPNAG